MKYVTITYGSIVHHIFVHELYTPYNNIISIFLTQFWNNFCESKFKSHSTYICIQHSNFNYLTLEH